MQQETSDKLSWLKVISCLGLPGFIPWSPKGDFCLRHGQDSVIGDCNLVGVTPSTIGNK